MLVASHHSRKDADLDHPYGHHRFETAASLALGLILAAAAPARAADLPKSTLDMLKALDADPSLLAGTEGEMTVPEAWIEAATQ